MGSSEKTSLFLTKLPVSHSKERKEKNCLNCHIEIQGRYCSICGQENTEPQESVWDLFMHFFNDITHFDGKFFSSVKYLFTKPGFLSAEYLKGRRASYLNPVRMYIFTSAIFFFLYFSFFSSNVTFDNSGNTKTLRIDSLKNKSLISVLDSVKIGEYNSSKKSGIIKEGILKRFFNNKRSSLKEKYGNDSTRIIENIQETFKHTIPQIFFFSLPLVALFLSFLYRRRKQFYYTAHIIFTIHIYVFVYIARIITELFIKLGTVTNMHWLQYAELAFDFIVLYYLYRAMKNFYKQTTWKTLLKLFCVLIWFFVVLVLLLLIMLAFTLYKL